MVVSPSRIFATPSSLKPRIPSRTAAARIAEAELFTTMSWRTGSLMRRSSKTPMRPKNPEPWHLSQPFERMTWATSGGPRNARSSGVALSVMRQAGQMRRTSRWARIPWTVEATRKGAIPMSMSRVIVEGASFVCSVEKTRCPVSAAWTAIWAVSWSRISPTMMTSGAWRSMERNPAAKVSPTDAFTSTWLTPAS